MMAMLINLILVIISQCICILKHHAAKIEDSACCNEDLVQPSKQINKHKNKTEKIIQNKSYT